jgi:hypothetical protein
MEKARTGIVLFAVLGMTGLTGCGSKMSKVAQGLTPVAANFYMLNQDIGRAREAVRGAVPQQSDAALPQYVELLAQVRAMAKDIGAEPELKKHEDLRAALEACLDADSVLLAAENDAIASYAAESRLGIEISDLAQSARGNSIRQREVQGQLGELTDRQQRYHAALLALLPRLVPSADRCHSLLQRYNDVVTAGKVVSYVNDAGIFDPFAWERGGSPRRRPAAKTPARPRTAGKRTRRR